MKKNVLVRTNAVVCLIIILGFVITSIISYSSNIDIYQKDVEQLSTLTSEGMYNEIGNIFSQPVSVSLTMANDSLLKTFLADEKHNAADPLYIEEMKEYLSGYRKKYDYDSVFLVSTETNRYYHFNGIDRTLDKDNPENVWYYSFLESKEEYSLNVDNDETTDSNIITVFVNCKIKDDDGHILGVVGVGLQVSSLQALLKSYEDKYGITAYLIDNEGIIEISANSTGFQKINLFDSVSYADSKMNILDSRDTKQTFWYGKNSANGFVVTRYEPNLKWHLIVENDTSIMSDQLTGQLIRNTIIVVIIILFVLINITIVIRKYNSQIVKLTVSEELDYKRLLRETTEELYESIYEIDITHNRAGSDSTKAFFESLSLSANAPYDKVIRIVAKKQIKEEYIEGYLDTFSPNHVFEAYHNGINNLSYDFLFLDDRTHYHWVRVSARIFFWNSDESVHMITYRKNIDEEKRKEIMLLESIQRDSMTGLYNKHTTEELVEKSLVEEIYPKSAFLIFDIDDFKTANDTYGHSFGDVVIKELAAEISTQFRESDIAGRIGGDEFAVYAKNIENFDIFKEKLERLAAKFSNKDYGKEDNPHFSCSIGVAIYPEDGTTYSELFEKADAALYYAKGHGKNSFSLSGEHTTSAAFHVNARDIETLLNAATDGVAKFACTEPLTLLYFNEQFAELTGVPVKELTRDGYDPLTEVIAADRLQVINAYKAASISRELFTVTTCIEQPQGQKVPIKFLGIYTNEIYKNKYPVFYTMYTRE